MKNHIVVYRPHGRLNIETEFFGPYTFEDAETVLSNLGPLGPWPEREGAGVKYIADLTQRSA